MELKKGMCERCGSEGKLERTEDGRVFRAMLDYCAGCSKDLCDDCMVAGCCKSVPAKSGYAEDFPD